MKGGGGGFRLDGERQGADEIKRACGRASEHITSRRNGLAGFYRHRSLPEYVQRVTNHISTRRGARSGRCYSYSKFSPFYLPLSLGQNP